MKKVVLSALMLIGLVFNAQGQDLSKNAIGLRLGSNDGFGAEVSYQRALSQKNRVEIDLGWRSSTAYDAVKVAGVYQWVWEIQNGFNWYAGVGGGLASWSWDAPAGYTGKNSGTSLFVAGNVGVEYNFDIPLQVSLDIRPELYFGENNYRTTNFGPDLALSVRYKFN